MSLITILMFLAIAASVCVVVHVLQPDKVPLWVGDSNNPQRRMRCSGA
jgi:hypothetical protein